MNDTLGTPVAGYPDWLPREPKINIVDEAMQIMEDHKMESAREVYEEMKTNDKQED